LCTAHFSLTIFLTGKGDETAPVRSRGGRKMEEKKIREALQIILHPKLNRSLVDLGMIRDIGVEGDAVHLTLALKNDRSPLKNSFLGQIKQAVGAVPGVSSVQIEVTTLSQEESARIFPKAPLRGVEKVRHFLAVASGKGGVGKTTIAVNLALALVRQGCKVGLLDADVYGPSIPVMLDISGALDQHDKMILPREKYGMKVISLGMTSGRDEAFIWRGPLVSRMIHQLLDGVSWGELDYLVIDLPPGTGDPSITIAQAIPDCTILMITTPQKVALADVRRAIGLFQKTGQTIVGLVENMSFFLDNHSDRPIEIFGHGGGRQLSAETGLPLLGTLPIDLELRRGGDSGIPLMVTAPDSSTGTLFQEMAEKVVSFSLVERSANPAERDPSI
jgi:ATP-binding protein involved in chromosome partitioning